ncbi:MAG: hypothetical protein CMO81_05170 [Waddliaceae bacterium]|nr:hypothetical protein [Waddliaceae bacterium]
MSDINSTIRTLLTQQTQQTVRVAASQARSNTSPKIAETSSAAKRLENKARISEVHATNGHLAQARESVASAALDNASDIVGRLGEIATRATDGQLNSSDRAALQQEAETLQGELSDIFSNTKFNGQQLFSGNSINAATENSVEIQDPDGSNITGALGTLDLSSPSSSNAALEQVKDAQSELNNARTQVGVSSSSVGRATLQDYRAAAELSGLADQVSAEHALQKIQELHKFETQEKIHALLSKGD